MQLKCSMMVVPLLVLGGCAAGPEDDAGEELGIHMASVTTCDTISVASWSASGNDGNIPQNAGDNNPATRWSSLGVGQHITADLGSAKQLCSLSIAWYNGNTRTNDFVISGSADGATFTRIGGGTSSGTTLAAETYSVTAMTARYVRVTVNGNSINTWASITELDVSAAPAGCPTTATRRVAVNNATALAAALSGARPGDVIQMADGVYRGAFSASANATSGARIALCGNRNAILDSNQAPTGFRLTGDYWTLAGFTVRNANLAIALDGADHNLLTHLEVYDTGQEGIHFRTHSTFNTLQNSYIHDTGIVTAKYGEGVYIGSAVSLWPHYTNGNPDQSDNNQVLNNLIGPTRAEAIDIKEGSTGGVIRGNVMNATGMSGENANSCVEAKGNNYTISDNSCTAAAPTRLVYGFQLIVEATGWGHNNTLASNRMTGIPNGSYGVWVDSRLRASTTVRCNNTVNSGAILTNDTPCNP